MRTILQLSEGETEVIGLIVILAAFTLLIFLVAKVYFKSIKNAQEFDLFKSKRECEHRMFKPLNYTEDE